MSSNTTVPVDVGRPEDVAYGLLWSRRSQQTIRVFSHRAGNVRNKTLYVGMRGPISAELMYCQNGYHVSIYLEPQRPRDPDGTIYGRSMLTSFLIDYGIEDVKRIAGFVIEGYLAQEGDA